MRFNICHELALRSQSSFGNLQQQAHATASSLNLLFCDRDPLRSTTPGLPPVLPPTPAVDFPQPAPDDAVAAVILREWDAYDWRGSSDALADWLNARWRKSGYTVRRHEVCFLLRLNGREARMGLGDHLRAAFFRV